MASTNNVLQGSNLSGNDNQQAAANIIQQTELYGGFDVEFVGEIKTEVITCTICHLIMREPVQGSPCGHRFCGSCIEQIGKQK